MCNKNFTKNGQPRTWEGQKKRISVLERQLEEKERELSLVRESSARELERLKLAVSDHEKTISKQGQEITKLTNHSAALKSDREYQDKVIEKLMNRSLWERIINKDV